MLYGMAHYALEGPLPYGRGSVDVVDASAPIDRRIPSRDRQGVDL
jgi:hypothetical protein